MPTPRPVPVWTWTPAQVDRAGLAEWPTLALGTSPARAKELQALAAIEIAEAAAARQVAEGWV